MDARGYRPQEVDKVLDMVMNDYNTYERKLKEKDNQISNLTNEILDLKQKLRNAKANMDIVKNTNWSLGIFPEGQIRRTGVLENIQKGFITIAKKVKLEIVPMGICGFDGYAGKKLFQKHITVKIGVPISYELPEDEIMQEWANQICELTGYENKISVGEMTAV